MTISPHIEPEDENFEGDASIQTPFLFRDSIRSIFLWIIGVPHLIIWTLFVIIVSKISDTRRVDKALKLMAKAVPLLNGIRISVENRDLIESDGTYVYVLNHVNIFDMFAIYQAIPGYTRSLELAEHFSWPVFGSFIKAVGQIPVDPKNTKLNAAGLKKAEDMLKNGDSLVVLPEGQRTLDGTVGPFYKGAFRLAIKSQRPVMPMAIYGGRTVSRRGDWRIRPGKIQVIFGNPIPTKGMTLDNVEELTNQSKTAVINILKAENRKNNFN
ncbi:MAG: 1-acyl-sn-glycerol-3-phosphate acyltransferase [Deltaproteobacteria bacterium]|nr:1-acyl-sn-glycerol-3-phosphate acyltransferase [Deltaproteobacteria bacterium]